MRALERSLTFGTYESRASFVSFMLKIFYFLIPALVIAHFLDEWMNALYQETERDILRIELLVIHAILMIAILYGFVVCFQSYSKEFQTTIAGGFFIALFFGFQPHYLQHLKDYMRRIYQYSGPAPGRKGRGAAGGLPPSLLQASQHRLAAGHGGLLEDGIDVFGDIKERLEHRLRKRIIRRGGRGAHGITGDHGGILEQAPTEG